MYSKNQKYTDLERVYIYLKYHEATAAMVCHALKIPIESFSWYKRQLEKAGLLWKKKNAPCKLTGNDAWYLTTNLSIYLL